MSTGRKKIVKKDGSEPTDLELKLASEIAALESSNASLKGDLKHLYINAAREVDLEGSGKKAILVFVPFPLLAEFRKIHKTLVEELEKKFGGHHVLIIANRTMIAPATWQRSKKFSGVRPRSRTLKSVQEALLDDLVYPTEIVGKRTRVRVHLNPKDAVSVESKVDTFAAVYKKMTNKDIAFEFPATH